MRHLRLIAAVVEHGSLTSAARVLGLTQPALSHQLRDLELRLRSPLFERTARRMVLTTAGEHLTLIAREVLSQVDAYVRQVLDGEFSVTRGTVRFATACYTAYHWLPSVLRGFRDRWPNVELRVTPEHTGSPIAALREGALDLALVYHRTTDQRIRYEPLFEDELVLAVAPDHRLAGKEYVPVKVLEDEHLFVYTSFTRSSSVVRDILESADVKPLKTTRLQLTEAILELVAAGFGVAILAKWAVIPAVRSGAVTTVRLGKSGYSRTWYAAVRSRGVTPPYQCDLIELLRRHLAAGPATKIGPRA
ncbi:MAG TPA: LysR family transcriptional regulator [Gemmatimonadaceae bacterium]|nr:LysR family transcriptional regulator [Gemmatimonadaceae bacterium]